MGRVPADQVQHRRDIGIARHRHPRLLPDEIEHVQAPGGTGRRQGGARGLERPGQRRRLVRPAEQAAHQGVEPEIVVRRQRMGDDHVGHEGAHRLGHLDGVLVDVQDGVGRRQRLQLAQIDLLGAADRRDRPHGIRRVDAEAGARDHPVRQAEIDQQFGDRRHEAGDPRLRPGRREAVAGVVFQQRSGSLRHRLAFALPVSPGWRHKPALPAASTGFVALHVNSTERSEWRNSWGLYRLLCVCGLLPFRYPMP